MPGLIDGHVHVTAATRSVFFVQGASLSITTSIALSTLGGSVEKRPSMVHPNVPGEGGIRQCNTRRVSNHDRNMFRYCAGGTNERRMTDCTTVKDCVTGALCVSDGGGGEAGCTGATQPSDPMDDATETYGRVRRPTPVDSLHVDVTGSTCAQQQVCMGASTEVPTPTKMGASVRNQRPHPPKPWNKQQPNLSSSRRGNTRFTTRGTRQVTRRENAAVTAAHMRANPHVGVLPTTPESTPPTAVALTMKHVLGGTTSTRLNTRIHGTENCVLTNAKPARRLADRAVSTVKPEEGGEGGGGVRG